MKAWIMGLAVLLNAGVLAALELSGGASTLNFVTVKNDRVAELMSFKTLSGMIDSNGDAVISIPLDAIDSGVDIRDTRMREHLFETGQYQTASYSAHIDMARLKAMKKGAQEYVDLDGTLTLHGKNASVNFATLVTRMDSGAYNVVTVKPAFVSAADLDLVPGIEKLKSIAGLNCIDLVVPVTFNVLFE